MIKGYSYYQSNIDKRVIDVHQRIMRLFDDVEMTYIIGDKTTSHYEAMDKSMERESGENDVFWLDIDCIPLRLDAFEYMKRLSDEHPLVGNIQCSNHIENGRHLFVAPSFMYINENFVEAIKRVNVSAKPNEWGDVAESYTYLADEALDMVILFHCSHYAKKPLECEKWETRPYYKSFGRFATFEDLSGNPISFHAFQMRTGSEVEEYLDIAEMTYQKLLNEKQQ